MKTMKIYTDNIHYYEDVEARTIACSLRIEALEMIDGIDIKIKASGVAKCSSEDIFDEQKGKRLAYTRAKLNALRQISDIYKGHVKDAEQYYESKLNAALKIEGCIVAESKSLDRLKV